MNYTDNEIQRFKRQLQQSIVICSDRCLYNSTKWSAEVLDGVKEEMLDKSNQYEHQNTYSTNYDASLPSFNEVEYNKYQYAKSLFHVRQYENVSFILRDLNNPRLRFLRLYASYLAGEKHKEEQSQDILGANDNSLAENPQLNSIYKELRTAYNAKQPLDAFCLYLYGVVLRKRGNDQSAASILLESIRKYEYNWSAWTELGCLVQNKKMFYDLQKVLDATLPNCLMKNFFLGRLSLDLHQPHSTYCDIMEPLTKIFPDSTYIKAQWAISLYDTMDYNESEVLFDDLRKTNPYRLEDMDVFSNLLYLKDSKQKLSMLAHQCERIDKYRPETCCIIANYYSIKREIPVSIEYFKRALKLNRSYHWVWTLLGHDYIEMKNTSAAIECYRRAIDYNHRDFRAWYGLGQAYEVLKLPYYAIYNYQNAADLRPHDDRMWQALGGCYTQLQLDDSASTCYRRAARCDQEGRHNAVIFLARIYDRMTKYDMAAYYYLQAFEQFEQDDHYGDEVAESALYLANYLVSRNELENVERFAKAAQDYGFPYRDQAQAILDKIKDMPHSSSQD
ncbi:anaphase promoting complex subunit 8 [Absidia repens]|uniref:Anaphase promoting complex subunit 8 n=1 Tax=Absidia repens TaxID=90262 RepID=A0A1X2I3B8_9FUNG|nr:anaphase promoting complex subunit 8 [Absidia repens]